MKTTVIVPTFDEGDNAVPLLLRMDAAVGDREVEVLFVDDGTDDLPEQVASVRDVVRFPVRVIRRPVPLGRLGGAVVEGIRASESDLVLVCDGDLQHPPELVPTLIDAAHTTDVVVASRYVDGGGADGLDGGVRRFVSHASTRLSHAVLPARVKRCTDPMSGFFVVHRHLLDVDRLRPSGFKILLEILVRSRSATLAEVPFVFGARTAGASHAGLMEGLRFAGQLVRLRAVASPTAARVLRFALVGASGLLPNLLALWLFESLGMSYLVAAALAVQASIAWNLLGAETVVWRHAVHGRRRRHRWLTFVAVSETDLLRLPFVVFLVEIAHLGTAPATVVTVLGSFCLRFLLADRLVFRAPARPVVAVVAVDTTGPVGSTAVGSTAVESTA